MATIACLLADDFEDSEFQVPYDRLREAGHDIVIVGRERGRELHGKRHRSRARVDLSAAEARATDYDLVLVPGGYSPDKLRTDPSVVRLLREFSGLNRPIAAICHAGSLLVEANLVRGRQVTSWPSIRTDLDNAGARWTDRPVVVDRNLITSRKPGDLDAFCAAILDRLGSGPTERPSEIPAGLP